MSKQTGYIRSHRSRVIAANKLISTLPEKISLIDREAFVEFFLLEDIIRLYNYRLDNEKKQKADSRPAVMARNRNMERFTAILKIFEAAVDFARAEISAGNYSLVWKSIPEHPLMVAASNIKHLAELREIAVQLLKNLTAEALSATEETVKLDEALDEIEDHSANVRAVKGLPSEQEIEEIIRAVEVAIPAESTKRKSKIDVNLN